MSILGRLLNIVHNDVVAPVQRTVQQAVHEPIVAAHAIQQQFQAAPPPQSHQLNSYNDMGQFIHPQFVPSTPDVQVNNLGRGYSDVLQNMQFGHLATFGGATLPGTPLSQLQGIGRDLAIYSKNGQTWLEDNNTGQKFPYTPPASSYGSADEAMPPPSQGNPFLNNRAFLTPQHINPQVQAMQQAYRSLI